MRGKKLQWLLQHVGKKACLGREVALGATQHQSNCYERFASSGWPFSFWLDMFTLFWERVMIFHPDYLSLSRRLPPFCCSYGTRPSGPSRQNQQRYPKFFFPQPSLALLKLSEKSPGRRGPDSWVSMRNLNFLLFFIKSRLPLGMDRGSRSSQKSSLISLCSSDQVSPVWLP